ncbi:DUF2004 domain-containing protein [Vannielia litorea]|uniref:DUF2004 domain-containing protein n=1 Tax=Vannielia litorea TaxID=1217970 RepID=UPI001BCAF726|nr:hypothetical protein [Vannielia litorea]
MAGDSKERATRARTAALHGTEAGSYGPTLFDSHHLGALEPVYWLGFCCAEKPTPAQVLSALVLVGSWEAEEDGVVDTYDFSLPGEVTDYLLSVCFEGDTVAEVSMES